jgi:hypothetical protein
MLVHKLRVPVPPEQYAEIVEPGDHSLEVDPVDEEDGDGNLGLADMVEKGILQLLFIGSHRFFDPCSWRIVLFAFASLPLRPASEGDLPDYVAGMSEIPA